MTKDLATARSKNSFNCEKRTATAGSETDFSYLRGNRQTDGLTDFYHWASWINTTGYHLHSNAKQ